MQEVGIVRAVYRYPVKSMAGQRLAAAELDWHGLADDRRFAFQRIDVTTGFPWLTAGKLPVLLRYRPYWGAATGAAPATLRVVTPEGDDLALASEQLREQIAQAHGADVRLMHLTHGMYDQAKLSLISQATVDAVADAAGTALDIRRFRPNLLIETTTNAAFVEDDWVGKIVVFGRHADAPAMYVSMRDLRCAMINLDPDTAAPNARILKAATRLHQTFAGVYGEPLRIGPIAEGDRVYLRSP